MSLSKPPRRDCTPDNVPTVVPVSSIANKLEKYIIYCKNNVGIMKSVGIRLLVILGIIQGFYPMIDGQHSRTFWNKQNVGQPEDFLVRNLTGAGNVVSYSGFFRVNKQYNSNIFFWFFPAQSNPERAPLLIWLQGGPGASSMLGLFCLNGPFYIDENLNLNLRNGTTWTLNHSVLYIDNPVGAGFSYTDSERGYSRNQDQISQNLYIALTQFYAVFPQYIARDLYITGESYAGKHVPGLAYRIHQENQRSGQIKINLKGFAIGNGFSDPFNQIGYGEVLYNFGLIDKNERRYFEKKQDLIKAYIALQRWGDATDVLDQLFLGDQTRYTTYFTNVTGYTNYYNVLIASNTGQPELSYYISYLQQPKVRQVIHAGNRPYQDFNLKVEALLREDFMKSTKDLYEYLLDTPNKYRVLLYSGQLDLIVPSVETENVISKLVWSGGSKYLRAKKTIWRAGGNEILGYSRKSKNLRLLIIRNSGHLAPFDQPEVLFKMISTFTAGKAFL